MFVIHVNRSHIAFNRRAGQPILPTYVVRNGRIVRYAYGIRVLGPSEMVDPRAHPPLPCGARAYLQTIGPIELIGEQSFKETIRTKSNYDNKYIPKLQPKRPSTRRTQAPGK